MTEANDIPRPDALPGWPAPEEQGAWFGDPHVERALLDSYRSGTMHHAWLLGGPKGIGKATLAYRFARFVLAHPDPATVDATDLAVAPDDPVARKVAGRAHGGLLILERPWDDRGKKFRTELTVDVVRRTLPFFGTTAGEGAWRIAIVDAADEMNLSAANALLKVLEEPPPRSLFLIVSHVPGRLLPTIRSRCRRLNVPVLPMERVESALEATGVDRAVAVAAAALSGGSLRRAAAYCDGDSLDAWRAFAAVTAHLPDMDLPAVHDLADRVATRGRDDLWAGFVDMLSGWLSRRVRGEPEPGEAAAVSAAVAATPLERWAEVWDNLGRVVTDTDIYNLDRKRAVLRLMLHLAHAARM